MSTFISVLIVLSLLVLVGWQVVGLVRSILQKLESKKNIKNNNRSDNNQSDNNQSDNN